jgi:hypothetical protein
LKCTAGSNHEPTVAIHCKSKGNSWPNLSITGIDTHLLHMNNRSNIQTLRVSQATKYKHYDINLHLLYDKMSCKLESDACVRRGIGWVYTEKLPVSQVTFPTIIVLWGFGCRGHRLIFVSHLRLVSCSKEFAFEVWIDNSLEINWKRATSQLNA